VGVVSDVKLSGRMAVIVPSRGRPENIAALIEAWLETATKAELHVMVDEDDPTMDGYLDVIRGLGGHGRGVTLWLGPRRRLGGSLNHLAPALARDCDVVGFMGDDHRPRTKAWDSLFYSASSLDSVVYGNDLIQGPNLPTAVFLGSTIIRTLGWMVIPGQVHLFMDNLWRTLGEQLGTLRYLPTVIIEHVHPIAGKAEWDDGYAAANAAEVWAHDEALYREWVGYSMVGDVARIKEAARG
jgi:hypothetical protein